MGARGQVGSFFDFPFLAETVVAIRQSKAPVENFMMMTMIRIGGARVSLGFPSCYPNFTMNSKMKKCFFSFDALQSDFFVIIFCAAVLKSRRKTPLHDVLSRQRFIVRQEKIETLDEKGGARLLPDLFT